MRNRRGFTLVEVLVVVAIIGLLATILIVALRGGIAGSRQQATKSTIVKVSGLLRQRADAFNRIDFKSAFAKQIEALQYGQGLSPDLAEVLARKQMYALHFPQTWDEVNALIVYKYNPINPQTGQVDPTIIFTVPAASNRRPDCESAEVLYWLLTNDKSPSLGYTQEGTDNFTGAVADTDGNGFPEFVDGWEHPLRWYRWPTRLIRLTARTTNPPTWVPVSLADLDVARVLMPDLPIVSLGTGSPTQVLSSDPDDPQALIERAYESQFSPYFSAPTFEDNFHTIGTYFSPLIVSAGPDGQLGLNEPSDRGMGRGYWANPVGDSSHLDNITNHQIRSGGR
jgi:prepilin-type N-terminal cleavage/methylation domain-containing protein